MSRNLNFIGILLLAILMCSLQGLSQTSTRGSVAVPEGESWLPINKFSAPADQTLPDNTIIAAPPLNNVQKGVSFYGMKSVCNSVAVSLLKVINVNPYAVKISWQMGPGAGIESVVIPARRMMEGACMSQDPVQNKLVIVMPTGPDKKEVANFFFSSIKVTELEK